MAIQKTEAFVLKTQPFRSSSLIVTFFSNSFGKLRGLVKGVRQEREMRGAFFELFTRLEIVFYEKTRSDLHLVSESSLLESNDVLRTNLQGISYASYFSELVDTLTEVHDPHDKIFELLDFSFRFLPSIPGERLARLFEIKLLGEIGWLPYLEGCLNCQVSPLEKGFFSVKQGALLCRNCAPQFPDARVLATESLATLRYYLFHSMEESLKHPLSRTSSAELEDLLSRFLLFRLGRPFKSRRFMQAIKPALSLPLK